MATELEVQLTADVRRLKAKLQQAKSELAAFGAQADKQGAIAGRGFIKAGKGAANAVPTLQEFSRVIQDAPFGIQGVANNITQLTSNFGNLSRAAGGTIPAIRLLLSSFVGPAGLLFAISTITSLLVVFANKSRGVGKEIDGLADKIQKLNEVSNLDLNINKLQTDILKLQGKEYSSILIQRKQILATQLENLSNLLQEEETTLRLAKLDAERLTFFEGIQRAGQKIFIQARLFQATLEKIAINELTKDFEKLFDTLGKGITISQDGVKATADETKAISDAELRIKKIQEARLKILKEIAETTKEISEGSRQIGQSVNPVISSNSVSLPQNPVISAPVLTNGVRQNLSEAEIGITEAWLGFKDNLNGLFAQGPIEGLTSFSQTIGNALGQGGNVISSIGNGILGAMGGFLSQFGKQLISYGVAALAFSKVTKALTNPITAGPAAGAAIAAGVALTAAGAALQSTIRGGFSTSGVSSGSGGGIGFSGATVSGGGGFNGRVVFEISGQKLIGVLNNSLSANQRLGGNVSLG